MNDNNYFDITDSEETVRAFQRMLRLVSEAEGTLPLIALDGVYGNGMEKAVREYQDMNSLPPTGQVDPATWRHVAADYEALLLKTSAPGMIDPFPNLLGYAIPKGERSDLVLIIQIMLSALSAVYDDFGSIPFSGVYDTKTANAVRIFQERNLIPQHDYIDLETWNRLARQYNIHVNDGGF